MPVFLPPHGEKIEVNGVLLAVVFGRNFGPADDERHSGRNRTDIALHILDGFINRPVRDEGFGVAGFGVGLAVGVGIVKLVGKYCIQTFGIGGDGGGDTLIIGCAHSGDDLSIIRSETGRQKYGENEKQQTGCSEFHGMMGWTVGLRA